MSFLKKIRWKPIKRDLSQICIHVEHMCVQDMSKEGTVQIKI